MSLIVQKFGGTSVADVERVFNVAKIITNTYSKGNKVVVVVSAQGDTTDKLIQKASEINAMASKREMDVLLSAGEQISIALLTMAIQKLGFPAVSLLGWQAGFKTDSDYGSARIEKIYTTRIEEELNKNNIVIIAGFQGINDFDDVTTLGRGGSDTSAVAIAASMNADLCQIYTDVEGVFTSDPRTIGNAHKLKEISYNEMMEFSTLGAQVLNNRSVEMAKKYNVELEVLSSLTQEPGTIVKSIPYQMEKILLSGVVKDDDVVMVSVTGIPDKPGWAYKLFSVLATNGVNVDSILQSVGKNCTTDITFTINKSRLLETSEILSKYISKIENAKIILDESVCKVSIVGTGIETHADIASSMFEVLAQEHINIQMISTSEIRITILINSKDSNRAVEALHKKFFE